MRTVSMEFTANEICATLEGIKTQMRYVINPQPRIVLSCYGDGSIETNQIFRHGASRWDALPRQKRSDVSAGGGQSLGSLVRLR